MPAVVKFAVCSVEFAVCCRGEGTVATTMVSPVADVTVTVRAELEKVGKADGGSDADAGADVCNAAGGAVVVVAADGGNNEGVDGAATVVVDGSPSAVVANGTTADIAAPEDGADAIGSFGAMVADRRETEADVAAAKVVVLETASSVVAAFIVEVVVAGGLSMTAVLPLVLALAVGVSVTAVFTVEAEVEAEVVVVVVAAVMDVSSAFARSACATGGSFFFSKKALHSLMSSPMAKLWKKN
jgi:hypothetical protein